MAGQSGWGCDAAMWVPGVTLHEGISFVCGGPVEASVSVFTEALERTADHEAMPVLFAGSWEGPGRL